MIQKKNALDSNRKEVRGMNRADRRRADKGKRKIDEWNREKAKAVKAGMHASYMMLAGCLLVLHSDFGFGENRLSRVVEGTQKIINDAFCASELLDRLKAETGIDLRFVANENDEGVEL